MQDTSVTPDLVKADSSTRSISENFGLAWLAGLLMAAATVLISAIENIPIRDPDSLIPGYIRFPLIVLGGVALDIVPRVAWRARRSPSTALAHWRAVIRERWTGSHWKFALHGVGAWYLCYAAFRNIKSMAPFVNEHLYDIDLERLDRFLWFGNDPAEVLHSVMGTGWAAHFMSAVYMVWIGLVPVTIAIALVWTRSTRAGSWYVTAVALDWLLGAATYLLLPTVGPIYSDPDQFAGLPQTYVSDLQSSMLADRQAVVADPVLTDTLQTIAAFASLHVGIMVTICLIVQYVGLARWIRVASWVFLGLTVLATVYLGWHFFVDTIAGAALGSFTVWLAAMGTGNHVGLRPKLRRDTAEPTDRTDAADPAGTASTAGTGLSAG